MLRLGCDATGKTVMRDRYMAYPLSLSPVFRLESDGRGLADHTQQRAYLYRMNTSPGLLAGDTLGMSLHLDTASALYLTDQAATKVHSMPATDNAPGSQRQAQVNYVIEIGDRATLEFLPEPLILFAESALKQTTHIVLHPTGRLTWGEIVLPGRLARGECYQFRDYWSTLKVYSSTATASTTSLSELPDGPLGESLGEPWLVETMKLLGKQNRFTQSALFATGPVMGMLLLCLPAADTAREKLTVLSEQIDALETPSLQLASSVLPGERGLLVRAIAQTTREMSSCFKSAANQVRTLTHQAPLPYSL